MVFRFGMQLLSEARCFIDRVFLARGEALPWILAVSKAGKANECSENSGVI